MNITNTNLSDAFDHGIVLARIAGNYRQPSMVEKFMSKRRIAGIVTALVGLVLTMGHFVLESLSNVPERYHGHEWVVAVGVVLMLIGFVLLSGGKAR